VGVYFITYMLTHSHTVTTSRVWISCEVRVEYLMSHKLSKTQKGLLIIEGILNNIFTSKYSPLYYLGAIAVFFMWIILISGAYELIYYRIAVEHAYESLQYLTEEQRYIGGIMRSFHRYASDGLIIAAILHLLRIYITDKYRGWRWVPWVSGVALLVTLWVTGILGYMMVWDNRAQTIVVMSAEMLDYLPVSAGRLGSRPDLPHRAAAAPRRGTAATGRNRGPDLRFGRAYRLLRER